MVEATANQPVRLLGTCEILTMGEDHRKRVDVRRITEWIRPLKPDRVIIERAQVMPQIADEHGIRRAQGASSGFKYGRAVGMIEAMILMLGLPLSTVEPRTWKAHLNLKGGKENKDGSRQLAIQLFGAEAFPLKKHHNIAEASLIAYHASKYFSRNMIKAVANDSRPLALPRQIDLWGELQPGGRNETDKGDTGRRR